MIRNRMSKISRCFCVVLIVTHGVLKPSIVITGDSQAASGTTFSFPINMHISTGSGDHIYVGAANAATGSNAYSLSSLKGASTKFSPIAFETVTLNGEAGAKSPLYNAGVALLGLISVMEGSGFGSAADHPIVVTTADATTLYLVESFSSETNSTLLSVQNVKDANGATTSGIIAVSGTVGLPSGVFAAVQPAGGTFGSSGSGIALASFGQAPADETSKTKKFTFQQSDIKNGTLGAPMAAPLDVTSSVLTINSNLSSMTNVVDLYWDTSLQRLYVALQVQAGAGATDGAQALAVGRIQYVLVQKAKPAKKGEVQLQDIVAPQLIFAPLAPTTVFGTAQNEIFGGIGSSAQISLSKVRTMQTSTKLDYLVVLGGNGSPAVTTQSIYALPLMNFKNSAGVVTDPALQGTLANKNTDPVDVFSLSKLSLLLRRAITTPATLPTDMYTSDITLANAPALVGGGPLAAGPIDDCIVSGDTVFAVVSTPLANQLPGIFSSQALLDDQGVIATWTAWQRVAGTTAAVFGAAYQVPIGNFVTLLGANDTSINTVERTTWGEGNVDGLAPLASFFNSTFPKNQGGVEGFYNFPRTTPALNCISMLIATGLNTVALAQTGHLVGSTFTPLEGTDFAPQQTFTGGALTADAQAPLIVISGGALDTVGPVVAAEIARNGSGGSQGFMFVGGIGGLAVLTDSSGNGWNTATGLGNNFFGLTNGMSFKIVGSYTFIRKLVYDGNFLYVLTDKQLDRLDLTTTGFPATTVANLLMPSIQQSGTLLDLIVSGKCAFLGTSLGLFRVGNDANIQTALVPDDLTWTYVELAEGCCPITQLFALSATGRSQDIALGSGGNLYVLNTYQGLDRGQVNRFSVQGILGDSGDVNQNTLLPIPDLLIKNVPTSYTNFGSYRNLFVTDGALQLHAYPRDLARDPALKVGHALRSFGTVPLDFSKADRLIKVVRNSATGSWLVAADNGLYINE